MTRVIHTADVHLSEDHPERKETLEKVLELGDEEGVDAVTVGGDLFDSDRDSESLRPELRETFSDRSYDVITIPGNHDEQAFNGDLHFGECFRAAGQEPYGSIDIGELRVTYIPYTQRRSEEVLKEVAGREPHEGPEALMLHCSLEAPFDTTSEGEGEERRYFPVTREALADLDFDYYLSGHFHSPHRLNLPNGSVFIYPGTPASVTSKEEGLRNVALLDTEEGNIDLLQLDTFHYDSLELSVSPGEEQEVVEEVSDWVNEREGRNAELSVRVSGHTELGEGEFADALEEGAADVELHNDTTGVEEVLSDPLFKRFESKLDEFDFDKTDVTYDEVRERTISIFSELKRGGGLA
jgi:DNA repair exonuclease SbcCD nuclease subunit